MPHTSFDMDYETQEWINQDRVSVMGSASDDTFIMF